jgi:hypothetical protein
MKINKDEYIKQCWAYINTTLKYLKDLSGNIFLASRQNDFKKVSQTLVELAALEPLDLKEGEFYRVLRHSEEKIVGRYMGLYTLDEDSYQLRFEILCATDTNIFYKDVTDIFDIRATELTDGYLKFENRVLTDEDWPLCQGQPFQGKLLEKLLKGKVTPVK